MAPPPPEQIDTWQAAERNVAVWMRHWGFDGARTGGGGADGGIDVTSGTGLAQVKFEAAAVGRPALQRLVGARGRRDHQLLFFSGAGYSRQAQTYADQMDIALFTYTLTGVMRPASAAARHLLQNVQDRAQRAERERLQRERAAQDRDRQQRAGQQHRAAQPEPQPEAECAARAPGAAPSSNSSARPRTRKPGRGFAWTAVFFAVLTVTGTLSTIARDEVGPGLLVYPSLVVLFATAAWRRRRAAEPSRNTSIR